MNGFNRTRRLLKKIDYDRVFAQAKKMITAEFIILYRKNTLGYARLGLALSKKMIPKSHDRNRMKRLLRETFRNAQLPGVDLVVLARPRVAEVKNKTIITSLSATWEKLTALYAN